MARGRRSATRSSAERRHVSLDPLYVFMFWFPFDAPTSRTEKQLYARTDLYQLAEKVPPPVLFVIRKG